MSKQFSMAGNEKERLRVLKIDAQPLKFEKTFFVSGPSIGAGTKPVA